MSALGGMRTLPRTVAQQLIVVCYPSAGGPNGLHAQAKVQFRTNRQHGACRRLGRFRSRFLRAVTVFRFQLGAIAGYFRHWAAWTSGRGADRHISVCTAAKRTSAEARAWLVDRCLGSSPTLHAGVRGRRNWVDSDRYPARSRHLRRDPAVPFSREASRLGPTVAAAHTGWSVADDSVVHVSAPGS